VGARARAGDPGALTASEALELATLGGAHVLGLSDQIGSLVPGKLADLAVISLVDSPFDPVEDPVIAVVLGGSPDRVAATLVAGELRYVKGTSRWPDSTRAARRARSKMLP
jgi:5-methylthioadenosine/S-adenosylhomocysteine deaminase